MILLATDLDRTLLPNGKQKYDNSMTLFKEIVKNEDLSVIYVTGRSLMLVKQAIKEFDTPLPDYIVGDVGTKVYFRQGKRFIEENGWIYLITKKTKDWNISAFKASLKDIKELKLQEKSKQNEFKLSYYIKDLDNAKKIVEFVRNKIRHISKDAIIVYSIDETINLGLLDILPKSATKLTGIEYIRKKFGMKKDKVIYCGDSGNDILPLSFGYKSILVRNSIKSVQHEVKKNLEAKKMLDNLYIAKGNNILNGYYVSGIIEGLLNFNMISSKYSLKD